MQPVPPAAPVAAPVPGRRPDGRSAIVGSPVGHSLSPVLHRAAYAALGLTGWRYDVIECVEDELQALLADSAPEVVGYSCTMPLKREVVRLADTLSAEAAAIGAANTLVRSGAGWHADNTDWIGILAALTEHGAAMSGSVVLLGAGGTAQSALAAISSAASITALVRDPARAAELLRTAERLGVTVALGRLPDAGLLRSADLVVSTLPAGAADPLSGHPWRPEQAVLDVIYSPWPTALAAAAQRRGATVVSGALMLLHQAGRQVELMTGSAAPIPAMRAAIAAVVGAAVAAPGPRAPSADPRPA
jgi:shikimate dehydrogenase